MVVYKSIKRATSGITHILLNRGYLMEPKFHNLTILKRELNDFDVRTRNRKVI